MSKESFEMVKSHVSAEVISGHEIGWEECTEAGLIDLLRGPLAQTAKERGMIPSIHGPLTQCETLKGNLETVVSRVEAGMGLSSGQKLSNGEGSACVSGLASE
jgi:hypothetical protein